MKTAAIFLGLAMIVMFQSQDRVKISNGSLEGTLDRKTGIRSFKGVPFAEPPVGDLRWKPPQTPRNWQGVRTADKFGPRCMQRAIFGDILPFKRMAKTALPECMDAGEERK